MVLHPANSPHNETSDQGANATPLAQEHKVHFMNPQLLRKEFRDIWPLGLLALLAFVAIAMADAELYPLSDPWRTAHATNPGGRQIPLISEPSRVLFGIVAAAAGLILGLWQTWSETIRGTWGYLLHRPISRRVIIGHKLVTGLAVLVLAMALPLAVLFWWALSPGHHIVGLEWRMGADIRAAAFAGTMGYLSAFLSGIRSARWYGSRYLVLGLGAVAIFATWATGTLWGWAGWLTLGIDGLLVTAILQAAEERNFSDS
jgi:hypothetical protein